MCNSLVHYSNVITKPLTIQYSATTQRTVVYSEVIIWECTCQEKTFTWICALLLGYHLKKPCWKHCMHIVCYSKWCVSCQCTVPTQSLILRFINTVGKIAGLFVWVVQNYPDRMKHMPDMHMGQRLRLHTHTECH